MTFGDSATLGGTQTQVTDANGLVTFDDLFINATTPGAARPIPGTYSLIFTTPNGIKAFRSFPQNAFNSTFTTLVNPLFAFTMNC